MADDKPVRRKKNVTAEGKTVNKRGEGLGTGPVGSKDGYEGRGQSGKEQKQTASGGQKAGLNSQQTQQVLGALGSLLGSGSSGSSSGKKTSRKSGGSSLLTLILIVVVGYFVLKSLGVFDQKPNTPVNPNSTITEQSIGNTSTYKPTESSTAQTSKTENSGSAVDPGNVTSYFSGNANVFNGWADTSASQGSQEAVSAGARAKRTEIKGNGKDVFTIMIYMCGTDLESQGGMATSDLSEIAASSYGDNVQIIVFTGGCKSWKNNVISSQYNQIYRIANGKFTRLESNAGTAAMTNPDNLASFIQYCAQKFPANRNALILWDHGGGSVTGYGYDEKNSRSGSMSLDGIDSALKKAGVTFDFIGFDACLMATLENGLMLDKYADYLIASEETEPGIGWYYTTWLNALGQNTSMPTVEIGKNIVDSFVSRCGTQCRGQNTTLSVVDLAELSYAVPEKLSAFSKSVSALVKSNQYQTVSKARYQTREFSTSSKIDQVDLIHLALNLNTSEGAALAKAVQSAVKYNKTSSNMTNAYGVSIYFPYQSSKYIDSAVKTYKAIGLDDSYTQCIRDFASVQVSGQFTSGGSTASPIYSLLGQLGNGSSATNAFGNTDLISGLLGSLYSGGATSTPSSTSSYADLISGLGSLGFLGGRSIPDRDMAEYLSANFLDSRKLVWSPSGNDYVIALDQSDWDMIHSVELNVFYKDNNGEGYFDLGLDNIYDIDGQGRLIANRDNTWVAINNQPVAYYHMGTTTDGDFYSIVGRIPALLTRTDENGVETRTLVELIAVYDSDNEDGYIAGVRTVYADGETDTIAKVDTALQDGDKLDFVCDYYTRDGKYLDTYMIGEPVTVNGDLQLSDVGLAGRLMVTYRITDIYNQVYWTESLEE